MRITALLAILTILFGFVAFSPATDMQTTENDFRVFLRDYESKVIPLSRESSLLSYNASISGNAADYEKSAQIQITLGKIYADTAAFAKIKAFRESGQITDPLLKRQLDILYLSYLGSQIDTKSLEELVNRGTAIEQKFNTFRVKVGAQTLSDNEVDSILRHSTNSTELEETWKASKLIGREVAAELLELVKLRNRAAQKLGFKNYYEMQITLSEQDPAEIAALFDQLDTLTRAPFAILKGQIDSVLAAKYNVPISQLQPWHYQNRFFQEAPAIYNVNIDAFYKGKDPVAIVRGYYAGIGLPVDSILAHSDLYERPGKYQHAVSYDIDRAGDVRIICNVRPDYSWTGTLLHELGHAVYDYYGDHQGPWLLRGAAHSLTTEAIANFFGRLPANPKWMKQVVGVPAAEVDSVAGDIIKMHRLEQVVFCRWTLVMVQFERALYENPDQDLNELWWDLVQKYQGLTCPEGRNEPDWASKIHVALYPVYYRNYLMGDLLASQLAETIGHKVLNSPDPFDESYAGDTRIGKFLVDNIFLVGARYPWNEMIQKATGERLTSVYYVREFIENT
jgi:peptidyl-dipeptidase A